MSNPIKTIVAASLATASMSVISVSDAFATSTQDAKEVLSDFQKPSLSNKMRVQSGVVLLENNQPAVSKACREVNLTFNETVNSKGIKNVWIRDSALNLDGPQVVDGPNDGRVHVSPGAGYLVYDDGKPVPKQWKGIIDIDTDYVNTKIENGCTEKGGKPGEPGGGGGGEVPGGGCDHTGSGCGAVDVKTVQPWKVGVPGFTMVG